MSNDGLFGLVLEGFGQLCYTLWGSRQGLQCFSAIGKAHMLEDMFHGSRSQKKSKLCWAPSLVRVKSSNFLFHGCWRTETGDAAFVKTRETFGPWAEAGLPPRQGERAAGALEWWVESNTLRVQMSHY